MTTVPHRLARTVEEASVALSFDRPLESGDPRWQDLDAARGDRVTRRMLTMFNRKSAENPLHVVFASHRGAGKTTELKRLMQDLEDRYLCVYFESNVEMDAFRIEMEDLLLVLAKVLEETMRNHQMPLPDELLERISSWFADTVVTDALGTFSEIETAGGAEMEIGVPFFTKLFTRLTALLKVESEHRSEVKSVLRKYPGTLLESVNSMFAAAGERLGSSGRELLLVIDNLDRYDPRVIDELLVKGGDRFRQLQCNFILTPPISLVYRPESAALETLFRCEVMPSVRLRRRDDPYDEFHGEGRELFVRVLERRIDLDALIPDGAARDRLVFASGGSVRLLLELAHEASLETDTAPISPDAVERVVERRKLRLRDRVDANGWWPALEAIARTKRLSDDPACLAILFNRLAFHYDGQGWYDIHPLLSELPDLRHVLSGQGTAGSGKG